MSSKRLYIIGNGFDLYHGVKSSYYDFRQYLEESEEKELLDNLEYYINCDNFWGDFENNLAYIDREKLMDGVDIYLDIFCDTMDQESEDFLVADFFVAIDMATQAVNRIINILPKKFKNWIKTLTLYRDYIPLHTLLDEKAKYINFNYTEFLESIYGINKDNILYIHGERRDDEKELVLGHGQNPNKVFEDWYEKNKGKKKFQPQMKNGKVEYDRNSNLTYLAYFLDDETKGNWKSQTRYDAVETAKRYIEDYYWESEKKTKQVIENNNNFFETLRNVEEVIVIGHSLSKVDYPYFRKIIDVNNCPRKIKWKISWHCETDKIRIHDWQVDMGISKKEVKMFKL